MVMRFVSGGIGHIATRAIVKIADTLRHFFKSSRQAASVANEGDGDVVVLPENEDVLQYLDEDEGNDNKGEEGEELEGEEEEEEEEDEDRRSSEDEDNDDEEDKDNEDDEDEEDLGPEDESRQDEYDSGYAAF